MEKCVKVFLLFYVNNSFRIDIDFKQLIAGSKLKHYIG